MTDDAVELPSEDGIPGHPYSEERVVPWKMGLATQFTSLILTKYRAKKIEFTPEIIRREFEEFVADPEVRGSNPDMQLAQFKLKDVADFVTFSERGGFGGISDPNIDQLSKALVDILVDSEQDHP